MNGAGVYTCAADASTPGAGRKTGLVLLGDWRASNAEPAREWKAWLLRAAGVAAMPDEAAQAARGAGGSADAQRRLPRRRECIVVQADESLSKQAARNESALCICSPPIHRR